MAKPSIFSKNYEKKMKRRKVTVIVSIIIVIALGATIILGNFLGFNIKNKFISLFKKDNISESNELLSKKNESQTINDSQNTSSTVNKPKNQEKTISINLSSGNNVNIVYEDNSDLGEKNIISVVGDGEYTFDISPDKKKIVIIDSKMQDMKIVDLNDNETDISKANYTTKKGKVYEKNDILKSFPHQIWNADARFIDDNNIAYISNLPYFGNEQLNKYIWIVDLINGDHSVLMNSKGKDVILGEAKDGFLQVNIDGNEKTLNSNKQLN